MQITDKIKNQFYDILVAKAGASESNREDFMHHWPRCREYRFMGNLGFGGKIWFQEYADIGPRVYVNCYNEDKSGERETTIKIVNALFDALLGNRKTAI